MRKDIKLTLKEIKYKPAVINNMTFFFICDEVQLYAERIVISIYYKNNFKADPCWTFRNIKDNIPHEKF